jgi:hypothetical protein
MIEGRTHSVGLVARLAAKAEALCRAAAETRRRSARSDPVRWRRAALLWPLFAKDR